MKPKLISLLLAIACTTSLSASITITVENAIPFGTASGGTGSGTGQLSTTVGSIVSDLGMPVTAYTVSDLDFTSIGGTASESFTFAVTYTATTDGAAGTPQFNTFGNVSVTGGANDNFVNPNQTLTASIALASTTFAGLSLDGLTFAQAGGMATGRTGTIEWAGGSHAVSSGNITATLDPSSGYTSFTLLVNDPLNVQAFGAQFTAIPEPSSAALVAALALGGVVFLRRRRKNA